MIMLFPVFLKILLKSALHDLSTQIITFASFFLEPVQLKALKLCFMIKFMEKISQFVHGSFEILLNTFILKCSIRIERTVWEENGKSQCRSFARVLEKL